MQTTLRAVSARDWLTPLAVLVPILATVAAGFWALTFWPPLIVLVVLGGLAVTAIAGRRACGARLALTVAALTLVAGVAAFVIALAAAVGNSSICGKVIHGAWQGTPFAGGAFVYFALGIYGFRTDRAPWVVPMALIAAVVATLVLIALVPGTSSYCD